MELKIEQLDDTFFRISASDADIAPLVREQEGWKRSVKALFFHGSHGWAKGFAATYADFAKNTLFGLIEAEEMWRWLKMLPRGSVRRTGMTYQVDGPDYGRSEFRVGINLRFKTRDAAMLFKLRWC